MEIQELRWWHWCLISLGVGWLLAFVNAGAIDSLGMRDQDETQFEQAVLTSPVGENHLPFCKDLIVYPPVSAKGPGGQFVQVMPVTYQALTSVGGEGEFAYRLYWFCARVPYLPTVVRAAVSPHYSTPVNEAGGLPPGIVKTYIPIESDTLESIAHAVYGKATAENEAAITATNRVFEFSHSISELMASGRMRLGRVIMIPADPADKPLTVRDWINEARSSYPWIEYRFAWWKVPLYENAVWVGGSFVVIGVLWPILLKLMQRAGMAGTHLAAEDYDLSRFATTRKKPKTAFAKGGATDESAEQLAALTGAMAESLRQSAGTVSGGEKAPEEKGKAAATWMPPPAIALLPPVMPVGEEKEFSGEFYPVAHPGGHSADQEKDEKGKKAPPKPL